MSELNSAGVRKGCLGSRDAAKFLSISRRTLWTWTKDTKDPFPHLRKGGRVLYPVNELEAWIHSHTSFAQTNRSHRRRK